MNELNRMNIRLIAMANADRNVRAAADRIALSINNNGIAAALRTLL